MRLSMHSGREGTTKHNERNFDLSLADNIKKNGAFFCRQFVDPLRDLTLEEAELLYYERRASEQNTRYAAQRHFDKMTTAEKMVTSKRTRPEEVIVQIGRIDDQPDPKTAVAYCENYIKMLQEWNRQHGGHMKILDYAIHLDESTPHMHLRRVWESVEPSGSIRISQARALEQAGVPLPHPDQPEGRYNNRKMSFDAQIREMALDLAERHGLDMERSPLVSRRHLEKADYIREKALEAENRLRSTESEIQRRERTLRAMTSTDIEEMHHDPIGIFRKTDVVVPVDDYQTLRTLAGAAVYAQHRADVAARSESALREQLSAALATLGRVERERNALAIYRDGVRSEAEDLAESLRDPALRRRVRELAGIEDPHQRMDVVPDRGYNRRR